MADNFGQTVLDVIPYRVKTSGAIWVDINTYARMDGQSDLLIDVSAINNAIKNLFTCHIGARGPAFNPAYGTFLSRLLQEPLDNESAQKIRVSAIQSLQKWEPRIQIVTQDTQVLPIPDYASYFVKVAYIYLLVDQKFSTTFILPVGQTLGP
jgi:phage baseplate assembly protein W